MAFWEKYYGSPLLGESGEPANAGDIERARNAINMLYAQAVRDDGELH